MKRRSWICAMAIAGLLSVVLVMPAFSKSDPADPNRYLNAVREFADNVLKYGRDTYGPKHTPLFVDGLNIRTHEPVKWIAPNGDRWILSNLASQQNLFRTLDGLTTVTGDPKYRQAAMDAIEYAFENLRMPNGLLHWGGHSAYDAGADKACGRDVHELKECYPYYELMWKVDPQATRQLVEAFWSGHVLDWSNLDFNRHCSLGAQPLPKPWDYEYEGGPVFFRSKGGLSFCNTGSDLCYAGVWLHQLSGDEKALFWSKRLACRYIEARNPQTGISPYVFSGETRPDTFAFPHYSLSNSTIWPNARYYYMRTPGTIISIVTNRHLCQLLLGEILGDKAEDFTKYAHEELTAIGKACYRGRDNVFVPISESGISLEGHLCMRDDPFGPPGSKLLAIPAQPSDFWAYAAAYRLTNDGFMWEMARDIALGNSHGDIGPSAAEKSKLNYDSSVCDPHGLLGFLELYQKTRDGTFLRMAERIGRGILADRFREGFFVGGDGLVFCKFDAIDSLALLHLHVAASEHTATQIPQVWPGTSFFDMSYRSKEEVIDNLIYAQNESSLPMSLQEAAAVGDIDSVRSLIAKGADIDGREDTFLKTALHHAAMNGHKEITEILLANSADVNAKDSFPGGTPLHYAAENGFAKTTELLLARGADVNATRGSPGGDTPLHSAARAAEKDTVELLIARGADVNTQNENGQTPLDVAASRELAELFIEEGAEISSVHIAAQYGCLEKLRELIKRGVDVDAKNASGHTALHIAVREGHREIVEALLAHGADVNLGETRYNLTAAELAMTSNHDEIVDLLVSKGADISPLHLALYRRDAVEATRLIEDGADVNRRTPYGTTPLDRAVGAGLNDVAELLIAKGADVNAKDNWDWTALHTAAEKGDTNMVSLLLAHGADIHAKDGGGRTPLRWAGQKGYTEIVELLRKHGAQE